MIIRETYWVANERPPKGYHVELPTLNQLPCFAHGILFICHQSSLASVTLYQRSKFQKRLVAWPQSSVRRPFWKWNISLPVVAKVDASS